MVLPMVRQVKGSNYRIPQVDLGGAPSFAKLVCYQQHKDWWGDYIYTILYTICYMAFYMLYSAIFYILYYYTSAFESTHHVELWPLRFGHGDSGHVHQAPEGPGQWWRERRLRLGAYLPGVGSSGWWLEHDWIMFQSIGNLIIPIDVHIFQGCRYTTNQIYSQQIFAIQWGAGATLMEFPI